MELEKAKKLEEALKEEVRIRVMIEHVSAWDQSFGESCEDQTRDLEQELWAAKEMDAWE